MASVSSFTRLDGAVFKVGDKVTLSSGGSAIISDIVIDAREDGRNYVVIDIGDGQHHWRYFGEIEKG